MSFAPHYAQLHATPLFGQLTAEQWAVLEKHAEVVSLTRGECIYEQGHSAKRMGFVLSGSLKLFRLTQDGQEKVFRILSNPEPLAEAMLFSIHAIHDFTAEAVENSEVLLFPLEQYRKAVQESPELSLALLSRLALMEERSLEAMEILSFKKSVNRIVRFLATQAMKACHECKAPQLELPTTKRLIASQLSIQPETLSRVLNQLEREGLLILEGRRICILDPDALLQHDQPPTHPAHLCLRRQ